MGKSSTKDRKSIKLTPGKQQQFQSALTDMRLRYSNVLASWSVLTESQKQEVLANSPILSGLKNLTEPFRG